MLPSFLYSQDFRNAYWGSTIEKVRKTEKKVDWVSLGKEDKIAFKTYVNNLKCLALYQFYENRLTKGMYVFEERHDTQLGYINDFEGVKMILNSLYGDSFGDEVQWLDEKYKNYYIEDPAKAFTMGFLKFVSNYSTNNTRIHHSLYIRDGEMVHVLIYTSIELEYLYQNNKEKENLKNF